MPLTRAREAFGRTLTHWLDRAGWAHDLPMRWGKQDALRADGRQQGDGQRSFFDVFSQQVAGEFRLGKDAYDRDVLEPIDSKGNVLLGDDGPLTAQQHVEAMRTHNVGRLEVRLTPPPVGQA